MNKRQRKKHDKRRAEKIGKLLEIFLQIPEYLKEDLLTKLEEAAANVH